MKNVSELVVMSVSDFAKQHGFTQVNPSVSKNVNGYPFVTFINPTKPKEEQAMNVYFSKNASASIDAGTAVKDIIKGYEIGITHNADGEERIKLITPGRLELADLL